MTQEGRLDEMGRLGTKLTVTGITTQDYSRPASYKTGVHHQEHAAE